jgi:hypothetical protein
MLREIYVCLLYHSDPAYQNLDESIYISGKDIEDIMFDQYISGDVINYYSKYLQEKSGRKSLFFRMEAWVIIL